MPNTIAQNLARLQAARTAIATAITAKGGTVTVGDGLEDFPADIATIPSGGGTVRSGIIIANSNISNLSGNVYRIGNIVFGSFSGDVSLSNIKNKTVSVMVTDLGYDSGRSDTSIPFTGCAFGPVFEVGTSIMGGYGSNAVSYGTAYGDYGTVITTSFSQFKGDYSGMVSTTFTINGTFYFSW